VVEAPAEPVIPDKPPLEATRPSALARYWWLTAVRSLVALTLAMAIVVAGRGTARLVTFLGLYWMAGGLLTLRFVLAIRPAERRGWAWWRAWQRWWPRPGGWRAILLAAEGLRLRRLAPTLRP
jgi:hypothetical protein